MTRVNEDETFKQDSKQRVIIALKLAFTQRMISHYIPDCTIHSEISYSIEERENNSDILN